MVRATVLSLAALGLVLVGCSGSPDAQNAATSVKDSATGKEGATPSNAVASSGANNAGDANAPKGEEAGAAYSGTTLKQREKMVPFKMVSTKGETITNESLRGKVVLIDFWATWCAPCKEASPTMEKLHRTYGKDGLVVIGANAQEEENPEKAAETYQKEHGYTYVFTKKNDKLAQDVGLQGLPCFIFVDRKGNVRKVDTGFNLGQSPAQFEAAVKELLAEAA